MVYYSNSLTESLLEPHDLHNQLFHSIFLCSAATVTCTLHLGNISSFVSDCYFWCSLKQSEGWGVKYLCFDWMRDVCGPHLTPFSFTASTTIFFHLLNLHYLFYKTHPKGKMLWIVLTSRFFFVLMVVTMKSAIDIDSTCLWIFSKLLPCHLASLPKCLFSSLF